MVGEGWGREVDGETSWSRSWNGNKEGESQWVGEAYGWEECIKYERRWSLESSWMHLLISSVEWRWYQRPNQRGREGDLVCVGRALYERDVTGLCCLDMWWPGLEGRGKTLWGRLGFSCICGSLWTQLICFNNWHYYLNDSCNSHVGLSQGEGCLNRGKDRQLWLHKNENCSSVKK